MTLCVAWKWAPPEGDAHIYFAADTCVTLHRSEMKFGGVKIAEIPVIYRGPHDHGTGQQAHIELRFGFAFSGEYLAAFLIRELIGQVLVHIQGIGDPSSFNFEDVCQLVSALHQRLHTQIEENLTRGESVEFFFGGYCPRSKRVRVAKFCVDRASGQVAHTEILTRSVGESFDTIGSVPAQARFRELIKLNLDAPPCRVHFAMFRRLRDVILDPSVRSVGGAIQCGEFAPGSKDFHLLSAAMIEIGPGHPVHRNYLGGTDLESLPQPALSGLHVHPTIALPFNEDIATFAPERTFWTKEGNRVILDELVTVLPHDLRWQSEFTEVRNLLRRVLGRKLEIEHIGSTAVPNLPAVPTIDVLLTTDCLSETDPRTRTLTELGFEYLGFSAGEVRPLFRMRNRFNVNLLFAPKSSPLCREAVALREMLRVDQVARQTYGIRKLEILNTQAGTLLRYNAAKAPVLESLRVKAVGMASAPSKRWWNRWVAWLS